MTAPRRIIDEPSVREEIRDAVRRVRHADSAYDVGSAVARFEATLAAGNAGATKASGSLATKLVLLSGIALLVGSASYAYSLRRGSSHEALRPPAVLEAAPVTAPKSAPESAAPRAAVVVAAAESSAPSSEASSRSVDSLPAARAAPAPRPAVDSEVEREREVKHLVALQRLAGSDSAGAIELAKSGHAEFPRGVLFQEREIILVEALAKVGRESEARSRATEFVKRYPKSAATPRLRAIADGSAP